LRLWAGVVFICNPSPDLNARKCDHIRIENLIKWLNMEPKPDKGCEECGDIVLLSEIMSNSMYRQEIERWDSVEFRPDFYIFSVG